MENDSEQQVDARAPMGVVTDDEESKGFCRVTCVVPELKTKKGMSGGKVVDKPSVGKFICKFGEESFNFEVKALTKQKREIIYRYEVKKLPGGIIGSQSSYKLKDGKVVINLKKADAKSWESDIRTNGLDQFNEEDQ